MCVSLKYCVVQTGALKKEDDRVRETSKQMDFRIVFFELLLLLLLLFLEDKCNYVE